MKSYPNSSAVNEIIERGAIVYTTAEITAYNNETNTEETITLNPEDFTASNNSYTQNGGYNFPIGNVISKSIKLSINNQSNNLNKYDLIGAKVHLASIARLSSGKNARFEEGIFFVSDIKQTAYKIEITAYDSASFLDVPYSIITAFSTTTSQTLLYPTLWDYFVHLCDDVLAEKLGITLITGEHMYSYKLNNGFLNSDLALSMIFPEDKPTTTLRDIFGYIAQLAGGNAVFQYGAMGHEVINIIPYDLLDYTIYNGGRFGDSITTSFDGGSFGEVVTSHLMGGTFTDTDYVLLDDYNTPPVLEYGEVLYKKVQISYPMPNTNKEGVAEYTEYSSPDNTLELYNPIAQDNSTGSTKITACARNIYSKIAEKRIKAFDGSFVCNPIVEFMDNVIVTDIDGTAYTSFVGEHTMNYLGTSDISNHTPSKIQNSRTFL